MRATEIVGILAEPEPTAVGDPARLRVLEDKITAAGRAVIEAGAALRCIRDERLYVTAGFPIFDDYCRDRWELNREMVDRMIRQAAVAEVLEGAGKPIPKSEYALRVLAPLLTSPIGLVETWERAEAEAAGGRVTGVLLDKIIRDGAGAGHTGVIVDPAPEPAVLEPAPAGGVDVDWDAVIRGEIELDKSTGGGGEPRELTEAQRISRLTKMFERITAWAERAAELAGGLNPDSVEDDSAIGLDAAASAAVIALDGAAGNIQAWFSGDDAGLPEPEITEADFPPEFKYV